jgi:hypothetical protein
MDENEISETNTSTTAKIKAGAEIVTAVYVTAIATKGLYDLGKGAVNLVKEKRAAKKAQTEN